MNLQNPMLFPLMIILQLVSQLDCYKDTSFMQFVNAQCDTKNLFNVPLIFQQLKV